MKLQFFYFCRQHKYEIAVRRANRIVVQNIVLFSK